MTGDSKTTQTYLCIHWFSNCRTTCCLLNSGKKQETTRLVIDGC